MKIKRTSEIFVVKTNIGIEAIIDYNEAKHPPKGRWRCKVSEFALSSSKTQSLIMNSLSQSVLHLNSKFEVYLFTSCLKSSLKEKVSKTPPPNLFGSKR